MEISFWITRARTVNKFKTKDEYESDDNVVVGGDNTIYLIVTYFFLNYYVIFIHNNSLNVKLMSQIF